MYCLFTSSSTFWQPIMRLSTEVISSTSADEYPCCSSVSGTSSPRASFTSLCTSAGSRVASGASTPFDVSAFSM